jgi:hypothetical protein
VFRQRLEYRLINGFEPRQAGAFELFKRLVVDLNQQGPDAGV